MHEWVVVCTWCLLYGGATAIAVHGYGGARLWGSKVMGEWVCLAAL